MTDLIVGKVAQILSNQDLVLNKGTEDGVQVGSRFAILSPKGADIEDPDTGEILGSVEIAKTLVKIVSVTPRVSIGRTFRTIESSGWSSVLALGSTTTRHETLRTDERRLQQELDPKDSFINIGDVAVQYVGEYSGVVYDF